MTGGLVGWFVTNRIAANLLGILIIASGLMALPLLKQEADPAMSMDVVNTVVRYPGASPGEVENGVCVPIEEAIAGVQNVAQISSLAVEGACTVSAEMASGSDLSQAVDLIEARVRAIDTLPDGTKTPLVAEVRLGTRVLTLAVTGSVDLLLLRQTAERLRDELLALPAVTQVSLSGAPEYELEIEVSESRLRRHGLRFGDIVEAVRTTSVAVPAGSIRGAADDVRLRIGRKVKHAGELAELPIRSGSDGSRLLLRDVAIIVEGLEENDQRSFIDGSPAVLVHVDRGEGERLLDVSRAATHYVHGTQEWLPKGVSIRLFADNSKEFESRRSLLVANGWQGLLLVLLLLAFFLRPRVAIWVGIGIVVSFLGALAVMGTASVSLNSMTLFAFIVALGLVVDDAIVIGENVHRFQSAGTDPVSAAVVGTREVAVPVVVAAISTAIAFLPAVFLPTIHGKFSRPLSFVVVSCLAVSLVEALLILPSHLAHPVRRRATRGLGSSWTRIQATTANGLQLVVSRYYSPLLSAALRERYFVACLAGTVLLSTFSLVLGGWIPFTFQPPVEGDRATAFVTLPEGASVAATTEAVRKLEDGAWTVLRELDADGREGESDLVAMASSVGEQPFRRGLNVFDPLSWSGFLGVNLGEVHVEFNGRSDRHFTSTEFVRRWREMVGSVPGAIELSFTASGLPIGSDLEVHLSSLADDATNSAVSMLKSRLHEFPGVHDVADSRRGGKLEALVRIRPEAEAVGLTLADLAAQLRSGFHGEEIQRVQRGRNDVAVVVRYPRVERHSLGDLEAVWIRTEEGDSLPFASVADIEFQLGPAEIRRTDHRRIVGVTANVDPELANANEVAVALAKRVLPELTRRGFGVRWSFAGQQREQSDTIAALTVGLVIALIAIYSLLAIALGSYVQPVIVMLSIPFGVVGAILGHVLVGLDLSVFAFIGVVALSGVVVNDSLVLLTAANRNCDLGMETLEAIADAGQQRFRAILLTSLTTFAGLSPILLETSPQAQWLKPAAVSLAFGVLFATLVTPLVVPCAALILEDIKGRLLAQDRRLDPSSSSRPDLGGT